VIDSDVDLVLLCQPQAFRPLHYEYAVQKGKHCFVEKPCAIDPVGARKVQVASRQAIQQGLSAVNGFVRRWQKDILETYKRVAGGAIGEITSFHISRMSSSLWYVNRQPGWSDTEYMLRNWVNFNCLCGDHIVDNLVHEMDLMSMYLGEMKPDRVEATGGRARRSTGDMYDFFSAEFMFDNNRIRAHCTTRNINGCDNQYLYLIYGTKGYTDAFNTIYNIDGSVKWKHSYEEFPRNDAYKQELIQLVKAIRTNIPYNDIEQNVQSTMLAIMARESAYTGKFITWDQIMASTQKLGPETYQFGPVPGIIEEIPLAGAPPKV
jgi:predicted dehydrogenase